MKNKVTVLGFIAVAILCVTALIIWQDIKSDIAQLNPEKVELTDNEQVQKNAIDRIRREVKQEKPSCFVDWETGDVFAHFNLYNGVNLRCSFDIYNRVKSEVITLVKPVNASLLPVKP